MTWVNLNNVYLPQAGGTVSGNLDVTGNLTINDKTGKGTTYNVASEITALRDSVSQTKKNLEWSYLYKATDSTWQEVVRYKIIGKSVFLQWYFTQETKSPWTAGYILKYYWPLADIICCSNIYNNGVTNNVGTVLIESTTGKVEFTSGVAGSGNTMKGSLFYNLPVS